MIKGSEIPDNKGLDLGDGTIAKTMAKTTPRSAREIASRRSKAAPCHGRDFTGRVMQAYLAQVIDIAKKNAELFSSGPDHAIYLLDVFHLLRVLADRSAFHWPNYSWIVSFHRGTAPAGQ